MARRRGGSRGSSQNVAVHFLSTAFQIGNLAAVGLTVIFILAGVLGVIIGKFPVTTSNPLYNLTQYVTGAVNSAGSFLEPLVLVGIGVVVILGVGIMIRVIT